MSDALSDQWQRMIADSITWNMEMIKREYTESAEEKRRPSILLRPKIFIDGNQWCALYGENLQDGVAGFGDSPETAFWDFDVQFRKKLNSNKINIR